MIVVGGGSLSPAAVMLRQPRWAARRGTGRGRGGTHRYTRARRHRGARSRGRRGRASRRSGRRRDRDRARQRRSRRHRGGRSRRGTRRRAARRAAATRRAMTGHQQRSRDGGRDEEDGHGTSSPARPEAGLLQPGVDGLPEPGQASRACTTSPAIPASHEFGRYKVTYRHRGSIAQTSYRIFTCHDIRTTCHGTGKTADVVFVADDLVAWLIGRLADAGFKKLTTLVLGTEQQRALRQAAATAVERPTGRAVPARGEAQVVVAEVAWVVPEPPAQPAGRHHSDAWRKRRGRYPGESACQPGSAVRQGERVAAVSR